MIRYPKANGEVERAVGTVKGLRKEGGDYAKSLFSYRATPLEKGYSPAQLLMGRQIRTPLPQLPKLLSEEKTGATLQQALQSTSPTQAETRPECVGHHRELLWNGDTADSSPKVIPH